SILLENGIAEMKNWTGNTAAVFVTSFGANGEKWTEVVQGNYYLSEALVRGIEAQMAIIIAAREDIVTICDDTLSALKSMESGGDTGSALIILGAIAATTLTVASFGTAAAVVGAAFTITATMVKAAEAGDVKTGAPAKASDYPIGGETAMGVLLSMNSAVGGLTTDIFEQEGKLAGKLEALYNNVLSKAGDGDPAMESFEIAFKEPALADVTLGGLGSREQSADTHYLKTAAETAFPDAASRMLTAHGKIAGSVGGEEAAFNCETYDLASQACYPWTALRDLVQDLTASNGKKVKHTGEVILNYAKDTGVVDDGTASTLDKEYGELDVDMSGREHKKIDG
ncbi:MAG: hypothetical protein ACRD0P_09375, partial [Stackebrandtia sp.]